MFNNFLFWGEGGILPFLRLYEKIFKARRATDYNTIRRMRVAFCITKATDTHSEYVTLIAFPRQKLLRESVSVLL